MLDLTFVMFPTSLFGLSWEASAEEQVKQQRIDGKENKEDLQSIIQKTIIIME
jgi:hypothetical protein